MTFFSASFDQLFLRYNIMIATAIVPWLIGIPWLSILALPLFLTCITAVSFKTKKSTEVRLLTKEGREIVTNRQAA